MRTSLLRLLFLEYLVTVFAAKSKLYYFDLAGRGESIRLACAYSKFDYDDVRISRPQFQEMKEVRF
jgi:hypothetical protein